MWKDDDNNDDSDQDKYIAKLNALQISRSVL
jgi:hypothetical protein